MCLNNKRMNSFCYYWVLPYLLWGVGGVVGFHPPENLCKFGLLLQTFNLVISLLLTFGPRTKCLTLRLRFILCIFSIEIQNKNLCGIKSWDQPSHTPFWDLQQTNQIGDILKRYLNFILFEILTILCSDNHTSDSPRDWDPERDKMTS